MTTSARTTAHCPRRKGAAPASGEDRACGRSACRRKDLRSAPDRARPVEPEPARRRATDDLASAEINISIEQTVPGTPLDERLRREQTRALLDLLVDVSARRRADRRQAGLGTRRPR